MSQPSSLFEITRPNDGARHAGLGVYQSVAPRGLALGASGTPDVLALAEHDSFIGHLTRDVTAAGLSVSDRFFGRTSSSPVGLESPCAAGDPVSLEKAYEIEVEGSDYLYSGTGQIDNNTAIPQACSFKAGKLRIAQSGEVVHYLLTAVALTPLNAGAVRCRFEKL